MPLPPRPSAASPPLHRNARIGGYAVACQAGWFVCVMSAARGQGWLGVVFAAAMVALHLAVSARPAREARLVATVMLAGWLWDSVVARTGLLVYPNGVLIAGTAPYWMAALWALFAIQLNVLFRWLRARSILSACLGATAGPLSFRAGAALGAVRFTDTGAALVTLAVGWALLLPACIALARHWDGARID